MSKPTFIDQFSQTVEVTRDDTALLVIDMQNATGNRSMGLGALLKKAGSLDSADYRFSRIENLLVPNIQALCAAFRAASVPVIYITYGANTPDATDVPAHLAAIVKATNNIEGQPEHEVVEALTPEPGELVLNKTTMGAFRSTGIDSHLKAMGIRTVVCVGVSTNNCVAMTAMEACDSQYKVVIVDDATGTDSDEMQQATLSMLRRLWARIMSTADVIAALDARQS
ncbi:MAG: isochorismatase family cysteine hydrolase [Pseudomonadota bacterium]